MHKQNYRHCSYKLKSLCEKLACRFSNNKSRKQWAFTLAEVLITLGIIGIVAAMTIPTLINNYQKKETVTRLQKAYSALSEAYNNAQLEMGSSKNWALPTVEWNNVESSKWWNEYFIPYAKFSTNEICTGGNVSKCWVNKFYFLDGTLIGAPDSNSLYILTNDGISINFNGVCNTYGIIVIDINGLKKPNTYGKDIFRIDLMYKSGSVSFSGRGASRAHTLGTNYGSCNKSAISNSGISCGALIQMDGWQIKDDYPWN